MKKVLIIMLLIAGTYAGRSQTLELGVFLGGSNFVGDVGATNYIKPNKLAIGGVARWNVSTRYSYRASLIYSKVSGNDASSDDSFRQARGYTFANKIMEASLGMEFNFLDFDLNDFNKPITPYVYGGVAFFGYDKLYFLADETQDYGNHATFAIPMALGVKAKISQGFIASFEVGARYTFTDNIDGSNPIKELKDEASLKFGNINSDDWYVFTGVTLTYTFLRKPCYSCFK